LNATLYIILIALFITIIYSTFISPNKFQVINTTIIVPSLPPAFNGYTIVQLSDIHLGSKPYNKKIYNRLIEIVNNQNADMLVFTGDMVNNFAEEMVGFDTLFIKLKAKSKYAILGNHDYGDYTSWDTKEAKLKNFEKIKFNFQAFGFKLLLNEHVFLRKEADSIAIIGVENYFKKPKNNYAALNKAIAGIDAKTFQLLLSHNPTHWEQEVLKIPSIKLTLSGHTHAAQMGTDVFGKILSPAVFMYKQYNGLYSINEQNLYVSRGIGYIGLPMQIGLNPEISVIKLMCSN
jgi:predicted MPP superfamily phosphohydrolase